MAPTQIRQLTLEKTCVRCGELKPLESFTPRAEMVDGRRSRCRECERKRLKEARASDPEHYREYHREWRNATSETRERRYRNMTRTNRLQRYGITQEDYDDLLARQGGKCAICREPQVNGLRSLGVDHDHQTGRVRGLLCNRCNSGIGMLGDSEDLLAAALQYLRDSP